MTTLNTPVTRVDDPDLRAMGPVTPDGEQLTGRETAVTCPADGSLIGSYLDVGAGGVAHAVAQAATAFAGDWPELEPVARAAALHRFADAIDARVAYLARLDALQTGRPLREMTAQVGRVSEWLRYFAALALTYESSVLPFPGEYHAYTKEVPLGPVGLITPWNHPLLILCKKLAPALAAGNTCVIKPSELTPLSSLLLGRLALDAGIPPGVVNVVPGGHDVGGSLVADHRLARVDFTGGTVTGREVARAAAAGLTPATLELGGKAPVVVFDDVELELAVSGALFAAFIASGQTCVAGARILAQRTIADQLSTRLAERADQLSLGHPLADGIDMGPVASARQLERVRAAVEEALAAGARSLTRRGEADLPDELSAGTFYPPVVLGAVTPDMRIAREEVFGPVVTVTTFDDEDEAIAIANSVDTALGASIWTRDVARAHRLAGAVRAGIVWINDHHRNSPSAPWGGFGDSGYGRENGLHAYRSYLGTKTVVVRTGRTGFDWYTGQEQRYG
jgi:acyl-CoA reductase-like NAD-dependent aldehyde dehydrogenase